MKTNMVGKSERTRFMQVVQINFNFFFNVDDIEDNKKTMKFDA